jgi:outer membrane lipoprotein SlyB
MKLITLLLVCFVLFGCATYSDWKPTVDSYNDPNAGRIPQDLAECKQLSSQASGDGAEETVKGAAVGGLIGAAGGAALGVISGDAGTGAALGAALGGFGGGAKQGFEADSTYKKIFIKCMRNRGHNVLN